MKFKDCVQYLKENFEDISTDHIEEEVNQFLHKKNERKCKPEEVEAEINDNEFIELLQVLANWRDQEVGKKNEELKINQESDMLYTGSREELIESHMTSDDKGRIDISDSEVVMKLENPSEEVIEIVHETGRGMYNTGESEEEQENVQIEIISNIEQGEGRGIEEMYCTKELRKEGNIETERRIKINAEKEMGKQKESNKKQKSKKRNLQISVKRFSEALFKQSLLSHEDMQDLCQKKNFFLIDQIIVKDLSYVLEKVIVQLFEYYRENTMATDQQLAHFQNFFRIVYTLINNIFVHPNDEKYRTIRFSNTQVRKYFAMNNKILNLLESLFALLNFNINYKMSPSSECVTEEQEHLMNIKDKQRESNKNMKNSLMWKYEQFMGTKENMLFDLVLEMLRAITNTIPQDKVKRNGEVPRRIVMVESKRGGPISNRPGAGTAARAGTITALPSTRNTRSNRNIEAFNKEEKGRKEIIEIRKLYDERYKMEKNLNNNINNNNKGDNNKRPAKPKENRISKNIEKQVKPKSSYNAESSSDESDVEDKKKQVWLNNILNADT